MLSTLFDMFTSSNNTLQNNTLQNNTLQNNTLTGKEFTDRYNKSETKFYKILKKNCIHNGYEFINGLNIDPIPFNPEGECSSGGFYFTEYNKICYWLTYTKDLTYIAEVTIPDDAKVHIKDNKFKADKLILNLNNKITIKDHECWNDEDFCKIAVRTNGHYLEFAIVQNDEICELAVQQDGHALQFVRKQTEEICKLAVQQYGSALKYVINKTDEICKLAVRRDGFFLKHVVNQTDEICKLAVQQDGYYLTFVVVQNDEICKAAVQQNGHALKYVVNQTDEICKLAVQQDGYALKYVKDKALKEQLNILCVDFNKN